MKRKILFIAVSVLIITACNGQSHNQRKLPVIYGGIGAGLDYGGLGVKLEYRQIKNIGLFAGVGYNFNKAGTNEGISWKIFPDKKSTPVLLAMYGYNGVLKIKSPYMAPLFQKHIMGFHRDLDTSLLQVITVIK